MSRYKAYPEYKDSEVEWLGRIPSEWSISKIKYIASVVGRIGFRGYTVEDIVDEGDGALVLSPSNVESGRLFLGKRSYLNWDKYYESPEIAVEIGDILLVKTGSTYGKATIVSSLTEPATINPQMALLKKVKIAPRFVNFLLSSHAIKAIIEISNTGSGMPTMTQESINGFPIPMPPNSFAETIANFLDHETAKIDALIAKQQELIELLQEKRQAVISHAVTKGLNPAAPMKDSGVEWLGEVPAHWGISKLKYLTNQIVDGAHFTPTYVDHGVPFLRVTDIQSDSIDMNSIKYIPEYEHQELVKRCMPAQGDLLLSKNGTIGIPKIVDWEWEFSIFVSLCLIKVNCKIDARFLYYYLLSNQLSEQVLSLIKQSTVVNLHLDKIQNFIVALPPLNEQRDISDFLESKLKKYESQCGLANEMSELLLERRSALISAAVTGKIDVRDWQPA